MNSKKFKKIEEICLAVLEIPTAEREEFLSKICGEDAELRREVESLLTFENNFDSIIDTPPESLAAEFFRVEKHRKILKQNLGRYRIISLLGEGGMGAVYLAEDTKLLRRVALKVLPPEVIGNESRVQRFVREARAASALNHPNILTIYEIDEIDQTHFIAMEYVEGKTLHELIHEQKTEFGELVKYLRQAADGLAKAHQAGIVHRDLKPENIMVSADGFAKILDFGLAKLIEQNDNLHGFSQIQSVPGLILGTPGYMSPEQARGAKEIDRRSDIFSFGCLLYEAFARKKPFAAENTIDVIYKIIHAEPAPLAHVELQNLVAGCLKKSPAERFQNIRELSNALDKFVQNGFSISPEEAKTISLESITTKEVSQFPSEQRRQTTILSADFSILAEALEDEDPEEMSRILNETEQRVQKIIETGGGTFDRRFGDVFQAVWGANESRENDAEQAVRAALELQKEFSNAKNLKNADFPPFLKIGISTGLILLGKSDASGEFMTTGAAVNLAKRLRQNAPAGETLISHDTYRFVRGIFEVEEFSADEKNKSYLIKSAKSRAFKLVARGIEGIETRIVGRNRELEKMLEAFQAIFEKKEIQILTIVGEAGLGKSRLLFELRDRAEISGEKFRVFNGRASEGMRNSPYSLVRDVFSFRFEIHESDSQSAAREKLVNGILALTNKLATSRFAESAIMKAHFIGHLIGLDFSASPFLKEVLDDSRQIRDRALRYTGEFFAAVSEEIPSVIYLDDLHWADAESLDFLDSLAESCERSPLLILGFARPLLFEKCPDFLGGIPNHRRLDLQPLPQSDTFSLIEEILQKTDGVPSSLLDLIAENAAGNPFYIEELIKMLIDQKVIETRREVWQIDEKRLGALSVPPTLTGILQARLDGLSAAERAVLQCASVIGREFWDTALENFGLETDITVILKSLRRKELIYRAENSAFDEARQYIFKHALLSDVTYDTLLLRERQNLHKKTAEWLIKAAGERESENAAVIAEHFEKSETFSEAADWFGRAGRQAATAYAHQTAALFYQKALDCYSKVSEKDETSPQIIGWQRGLGEAFYSQANFSDSIEAYSKMVETAELAGDKTNQTKALHLVSASQFESSQIQAALETAEKAVRCGEQADDSADAQAEFSHSLYRLGRVHLTLGNYYEAISLGEKAIQIAEKIGDAGLNTIPFAYHLLSMVYISLGDFEKAAFYEGEEIKINRRLGNTRQLGNGLNSLGEIQRLLGDGEKAIEYYDEALALMQEIGNKSSEIMTLSNRGGARLLLSDFEKAETELREVIEQISDERHFVLPETYRFLTEALLGQNKTATAFKAAQKTFLLSEKSRSREFLGNAWRVLGMVAAQSGQVVTVNEKSFNVAECFKQSLQIFEEAGIEVERARALRDYAQSGCAKNPAKIIKEAKEIFTRLKMNLEADRISF